MGSLWPLGGEKSPTCDGERDENPGPPARRAIKITTQPLPPQSDEEEKEHEDINHSKERKHCHMQPLNVILEIPAVLQTTTSIPRP